MDTTETPGTTTAWMDIFVKYSPEQLEAALALLEPTRRKILELHFLYQRSLESIASRLHLSLEETSALCRNAQRNFSSIMASRNIRAMADN